LEEEPKFLEYNPATGTIKISALNKNMKGCRY